MPTFTCSRIAAALLGAGICLSVAALAHSQDSQSSQSASQDSSVADAARRSRDKKKNPPAASKFSKVITDDDLAQRNYQPGPDVLNTAISSRTEADAPAAQTGVAAEAADGASEEAALKVAKEQDEEIAHLKMQVADAEKDLDLARRQLTLDQDSYLANPDHSHDLAGKANLDGEKQQINDRQQDIERLKTRLAALEELKSHRKASRKQAPSQPENAPAQGQAQTERPAQTEKPRP